MGRLLTFLLYTGCRIGEALALKWENVDLGQRLAYIETSKNDDPAIDEVARDLCDLLEPHRKPQGACSGSSKADTGISFSSTPRSPHAVWRRLNGRSGREDGRSRPTGFHG
jgi:integrase